MSVHIDPVIKDVLMIHIPRPRVKVAMRKNGALTVNRSIPMGLVV